MHNANAYHVRVVTDYSLVNKKAQLSLSNPRDAKVCEIATKFDLTAIQGHPRSSILVSIESPCTTSY